MLRKETRDVSEKENSRKRQAALQTKGQKRWRAKGSSLHALIGESASEWEGRPGFVATFAGHDSEESDYAY